MKIIRKFFLLSLALVLSMTACSSPSDENKTDIETKTENKTNTPSNEKLYLDTLQEKADKMKEVVLATESEYSNSASTNNYYISTEGNDENDGLSEDNPITINKLVSLDLDNGDNVLFRRGDIFRICELKAQSGVTYSAYGEGDKPIISSSMKNYADKTLWEETNTKNVYKLKEKLYNVGIVLFDNNYEIGKYDAITGDRRILNLDPDSGSRYLPGNDNSNVFGVNDFGDFIQDTYKCLDEDLEFYSDLKTNEFYLYSKDKNPGERFESIEIGQDYHTFIANGVKDVTIDNLHITLTGGHGISASGVTDLTVKNCIFDWIGGSILMGYDNSNKTPFTRYGNAVQVFGACDGYYVYNNWIYQLYDTGITHQYNQGDYQNYMLNIEYYDNLIEYSHWAIEYYNIRSRDDKNMLRETKNCYIHDNLCRYSGYGWGDKGHKFREEKAMMICTSGALDYCAETEEFLIYDNVFEFSTEWLVFVSLNTQHLYHYENNTWIQNYGKSFARLNATTYFCGEAPEELKATETDEIVDPDRILSEILGAVDSKFIYVYEDGTTSIDKK